MKVALVLVLVLICGIAAEITPEIFLQDVREGNENRVEQALEKQSALATARDDSRNSALHLAVQSGNKAMVSLLLELEMNVDAQNEKGETPLHQAITQGNADLVRTILAYG